MFENLSLWWATNICKKDNMLDNKWYFDLKDHLNNNKLVKYQKLTFFFILIIKFLKNFLTSLIWYSFIKFISFSRKFNINKKNCFHSINYNF